MKESETKKQLIEIIAAALHGEKANVDVLSNELGYLAKRHKVFNLLYLGTGNDRAKKKYKEFLAKATAQDILLAQLVELFEVNHIFMMPIKGAQTKKRYPKSEIRYMNDIDVLCKPDQYKQIHSLLQTFGYDEYRQGRKHEVYFFAPHVTLEIHRDLVDGEQKSYYAYYKNIWDKAEPEAGYHYLYKMSLEDEYIYNLVHLVNHFKADGIGVRFIVDVYIYEQLEFDRLYVEKELEKLGLLRFYKNIRALAFYWFGNEQEKNSVEQTDVLNELESFVLSGGLFGENSRSADKNADEGRLKFFFRSLFPNYNSMKSMFPWLRPVLLPFAWLLRLIGASKNRKDNIKTVWNNSIRGDKKSGEQLKPFYQRCGL